MKVPSGGRFMARPISRPRLRVPRWGKGLFRQASITARVRRAPVARISPSASESAIPSDLTRNSSEGSGAGMSTGRR